MDFSWINQALLAQVIWILASISIVLSFVFKRDILVKIMLTVSAFLFFLHYLFLWNAFSWMIVALFWTFKNLVSIKKEPPKIIWACFVWIYFVLMLLNYEGLINSFPYIASWLATAWVFFLRWVQMRILYAITHIFYMIYNINVESIWWVITSIFGIVTIIYMIIKHWEKINEINSKK